MDNILDRANVLVLDLSHRHADSVMHVHFVCGTCTFRAIQNVAMRVRVIPHSTTWVVVRTTGFCATMCLTSFLLLTMILCHFGVP